jgi:peptidoglycan/LPS O-acetylase OafA/YrhL
MSADQQVVGRAKVGKPLSHLAALDGLRGIAVILVLIFHFSWAFPEVGLWGKLKQFLWAGWLGVDLFFVLSGFLITRGLVKESTFSVGQRMKFFWARRAVRIFPLYYIVLAVGAAVCLFVGREHFPGWSYWLYAQNYTLAFDPMHLRWTAHFWSLAIEEQFYFVWPVFMLLLAKRNRLPVAVVMLVCCMLLRTGLLIALPKVQSLGWDKEQTAKFVYRATLTHMDGLLFGAMLAILERDPESRLSQTWAKVRRPTLMVSFVILLGLIFATKGFGTYDRRVMLIGYPVMALCFGAAVSVAAAGELPKWLQSAFSSGVLAACGKVSYGMYIFHWLFVAFLAPVQEHWGSQQSPTVAALGGFAVVVIGIIVTYGLAVLSFRFVEAPFLKLKDRFHD